MGRGEKKRESETEDQRKEKEENLVTGTKRRE